MTSSRRKRHSLGTRAWHWVNAVSVIILFMSGLNISNAHRYLYWGKWGFAPEDAWLAVPRFPGWATIPNYYNLAAARDWHIIFAWVFAVSLLLFMAGALVRGHFRRDLFMNRKEWWPANLARDARRHLRLDFGAHGGGYNSVQKLAYAAVIFVLLPLMIFTGMVMSPGMEAAWPFLTEMFGGRQSARSIHFIAAFALFAFLIVHLIMVLLSGPVKQIRDMITGGHRP